MSSFNKVILLGRLTRDPELKHINGDQSVASIGLAMSRKYKARSGEAREETTFVDCEAWGKTAETIAQYFSKGRPILIEGRLKLDTWEDKNSGQNRSKLSVVVERFSFVGDKPESGGGTLAGTPQDTARHQPVTSEEIPF